MLNFTAKYQFIVSSLVLTSIALAGCQTVSVKQQAFNITITNERDSILTHDKLSEASLNVLSMTGRESKTCMNEPTSCLADIKQIPQVPNEQFFSTASELYLAKAMSLEKTSACKSKIKENSVLTDRQKEKLAAQNQCINEELLMLDHSIRYSYAYLFKTERHPDQRIFDNRQVQVRDFYNQATAKLLMLSSTQRPANTSNESFNIGNNKYIMDLSDYPQLQNHKIEDFISSYNLNFSGLRSINRRDGFGSEFVTVLPRPKMPEENKYILDPLHHTFKDTVNPNIHPPQYLATTIAIEPEAHTSLNALLTNAPLLIKTYDPYQKENITVEGQSYPLAANFSAPYGLWLANNNLGRAAYLSLIDRDQQLIMPHLYMLEPYNPNKKIIVLVHGLASSPEAWVRLTNDIMGDKVLREHYQVWQIFYSTNMPMIESRYQIYAIITQAFGQLDQNSPSAKDAVLIGHSMGGVISRLLVSNEDISQNAFKLIKSKQLSKHNKDPIVLERLQIHSINNFDRAVFLASPHRGTEYADRWFTRAARKIIRLPGAFLGAVADSFQSEISPKDFIKIVDNGLIQNGPSDLSYKSKFMLLTENIMPKSGLEYHSIIGNITNSTDPNIISDGIVPYKSAHLAGAESEKIIHGGHSIQETPEAVLELRRILRLHLIEHGLYKPTKNN
ncbi:esterase/lipase family protein [Acinetobacter nectaris]|uniref:esterase/lipase family protein n=1 Tax=Acinetobacter nectaris TaxID=1219382 RepID=UPI001F2A06F7|nr:alpha/beta fold hydrolase [Acinetobacter nectaris]MCF8998156.1 alpha/beta fold hydrolase [Acinetobacter nectaris]MCF9026918.1 alpha/beta fold hydrolase [Acinetobacter nectaris]